MLGTILDEVLDVEAAMEFRLMLMCRLERLVALGKGDPIILERELVRFERMLIALKVPQSQVDWFINYAHDHK